MNKSYKQVKEFHKAFNHPVSDVVTPMSQERALVRASWMKEEILEFLVADNVVEQVDAMIDLLYFALGTLVEIGMPPKGVFNLVHKANMSKLHNGVAKYGPDGKVIKPEGWVAPDAAIKEYIRTYNYQSKD